MTAPARTVDDYFDGLELASRNRAVPVSDVVRVVHGASSTRAQRDDTELALDELVAQGRAVRDVAGRYQARRPAAKPEPPPDPAVETWTDDGGAPPAPDPVTYTEPEVHPEPDVPDPPAPSEILDPETLQPEDPAECDDTADVSTVGAHVAELGAPVSAESLQTIEDVAARHASRPELDSVEAVLEEASALRRRTEVALAVASRDVAEANVREAAARAEHEAAFRAAKAKSERLRQVQQLAAQLGVETGTSA